jgi:ribosomal protein S27E
MTIDSNNGGERVRLRIAMLEEASKGRFENLECPDCRKPTASVWFTNPAPGEYRTWLLCALCDFHSHVMNSGKPRYFTEDRRRNDLEERDKAVLNQMVARKPHD